MNRFGMDTVHFNPLDFSTVETHRPGPLYRFINVAAIGLFVGDIGFLASCGHNTPQTITQVGSVTDRPTVMWLDQVTPPAVLTLAEARTTVGAQGYTWTDFTTRAHLDPDQPTYDQGVIRAWLPK